MPRIVFHHINKCAGTTLLKYFQNLVSADECFFVEENWMPGEPVDFDAHRLARARFIHDPYGVWTWLDKLTNARTVCFLRDPFDRLISEWWMVHRWSDAEAEAEIDQDGYLVRELAHRGATEFLASEHPHVRFKNWNRITRHLACAPNECYAAWLSGELYSEEFKAFIRAKAEKTLRSLSFIGFQEDFSTSISALQLWMGLPSQIPQPLNVHGSAQRHTPTAETATQAAEDLIDLDNELVGMARELYEEQLDGFRASYGDDFASAATERYRNTFGQPPKWAASDMARPLNGTGWHSREINGSKHSRWIGPDPQATFDIHLQKEGDLFIRFRVTNVLSSSQVDNLNLMVDGHKVELHRWLESTFVFVFDAIVPAEILDRSNNIVHLLFDCAETITNSNPDDRRQLGIEICEIEIGTKDQFIIGRRGTPESARGRLSVCCSRQE